MTVEALDCVVLALTAAMLLAVVVYLWRRREPDQGHVTEGTRRRLRKEGDE